MSSFAYVGDCCPATRMSDRVFVHCLVSAGDQVISKYENGAGVLNRHTVTRKGGTEEPVEPITLREAGVDSMEDVVNEKPFHRLFCSKYGGWWCPRWTCFFCLQTAGGSVGSREPGSVEMMRVSMDRDVFKISRGVRWNDLQFREAAVVYHEAESPVFAFLPCFSVRSGIKWTGQVPDSSHFTAAFWNQQIDGPMASHAVSGKAISWLHFSNVFGLQKGPHWVT